MTHPLLWPVYGYLALLALWVFFLAVMRLKQAKDAGRLTFWDKFDPSGDHI